MILASIADSRRKKGRLFEENRPALDCDELPGDRQRNVFDSMVAGIVDCVFVIPHPDLGRDAILKRLANRHLAFLDADDVDACLVLGRFTDRPDDFSLTSIGMVIVPSNSDVASPDWDNQNATSSSLLFSLPMVRQAPDLQPKVTFGECQVLTKLVMIEGRKRVAHERLPDPRTRKQVRDLVDSGLYGDVDVLVAYAISLVPEPQSERAKLLDEMTHQAMQQVRQGKSRELTPEVWEEIIAESDRMIAEGTPIPWYISGEEATTQIRSRIRVAGRATHRSLRNL